MKLAITTGEIGSRPPVTQPHPGFLHELGEERFKKLVYDHYELIRTSDVAFLFPVQDDEEFNDAKNHAFWFFIQVCGGPNYFEQYRGEPHMIGRHAPFRIDASARENWLSLYIPLLEELEKEGVNKQYIQAFWNYLDIFSIWMINS